MTGQTGPLTDEQLTGIRDFHERTTHPDWRDTSHTGLLLAEVDRLRAENARLRDRLDSGAAEIATQWGVHVEGHPVRDATSEIRARRDLAGMRHAHPGARLAERTVHYGPWHAATETAEETR